MCVDVITGEGKAIVYFILNHATETNRIVHATQHPYMGRMKPSLTQRIRYKLSQTRYHFTQASAPVCVVCSGGEGLNVF